MKKFYHTSLDENKTIEFKNILTNSIESSSFLKINTDNKGGEYKPTLVDPIRDDLKSITTYCADKVKSLVGVDSDLTLKSMWAVYGQKNCFHPMHNHVEVTKSNLVSILYLDAMGLTSLYYIVNGKRRYFYPKTGDLVVFPVDTYHGTVIQKEETRITLNMDWVI